MRRHGWFGAVMVVAVATLGIGIGDMASASGHASVPGVPWAVGTAVGDSQIQVSWNAPLSDGGSPVLSYTVVSSPGNVSVTVLAPLCCAVVKGLKNGTSYTFAVYATNAVGNGRSAKSYPAIPKAPWRAGYWMIDAGGHLYAFGDAIIDSPLFPGRPVAIAAVEVAKFGIGQAYWIVDAAGSYVQGGLLATSFNAPPALRPGESITTISGTPSAHGYWLFTNLGRVFPHGDAHFYGDMSRVHLNRPIIASAATPTGHGYYLVGADGGIFGFGDAHFRGSTANLHLNKPIVGIAPTPDNTGYWLVASDGGVFGFHAPFRGSMGGTHLNRPVIGMVAYGNGYLMVGSDGGIFAFSNKPFAGSLGNHPPATPIIGVAAFTY